MVLKQLIESVKLTNDEGIQTQLVADNIKAASIVISMSPMVIAYPFIQKYFTKGIMLGAVKG
jgi:putative aldouronate transport system permease protein